MRHVLLSGVTVAVLLGWTSATRAAEFPAKAPVHVPSASVFDWSGFYLGAAGGWTRGTSRHLSDPAFDSGSFRIDGGLIGVTAGHNWQSGKSVLGIEGDLSWAKIGGVQFVTCGDGCRTDLEHLATARVRTGYANGPTMAYFTAGAAFTRVRMFALNGAFDGKSNEIGWTAGAGVEGAINRNWSWKAEYLYVAFGTGGRSNPFNNRSDFARLHMLRAGINFRF